MLLVEGKVGPVLNLYLSCEDVCCRGCVPVRINVFVAIKCRVEVTSVRDRIAAGESHWNKKLR